MDGLGEILEMMNGPAEIAFNEQHAGVDISEISSNRSSVGMKTQTLTDIDVVPWLNQRFAAGDGDDGGYDIMRVVWVNRNNATPHRHDISTRNHALILNHYELKTAFRLISDGAFICLPGENRHHSQQQHFSLGLSGHIATLVWKYDLITNQSIAMWTANNTMIPISAAQKVMEHRIKLVRHPMFIAFVIAICISHSIQDSIKAIREKVNQVENRTQHCHSSLLSYSVATGSYASLSAMMSGNSTSLSLLEGRSQTLHVILDTISAYRWPQDVEKPSWTEAAEKEFDECVAILKKRLRGQEDRSRYLSRRTDIQLNALFNLITQQETQLSISVAQDSRKLASATKDDSTAMKTLAAVTVFFLPGTFVAAFFSMPLFRWNTEASGNSIVSKQMWVYWAVTLPLTFVTLSLWLAWMRLQTRRHRVRDLEWRETLDREINGPPLELGSKMNGVWTRERNLMEK